MWARGLHRSRLRPAALAARSRLALAQQLRPAAERGGPALPARHHSRAHTWGAVATATSGLVCCSAVALRSEVHADDDFSEPFGGSTARTVGVATVVVSGAAWIAYDLMQAADRRRAKNAAARGDESPPDREPLPVVTREELDGGYTGVARYESKQGWTYEGDWKDGKRQGQGTLLKGGLKITATWHGNALHGEGVMEFGSGDRYEGQFEDGQLGPNGQYFSAEGWTYSGQWRDGQMSGAGIRVDATQGSTYEGGFADGTRDGDGIFSWIDPPEEGGEAEEDEASGGSLACGWADGEPVGEVKITLSPSGVVIRGNLRDGVWDGEVVTTAADGSETIDVFEDGVWEDGVGNFVAALEAMITVAALLESW